MAYSPACSIGSPPGDRPITSLVGFFNFADGSSRRTSMHRELLLVKCSDLDRTRSAEISECGCDTETLWITGICIVRLSTVALVVDAQPQTTLTTTTTESS